MTFNTPLEESQLSKVAREVLPAPAAAQLPTSSVVVVSVPSRPLIVIEGTHFSGKSTFEEMVSVMAPSPHGFWSACTKLSTAILASTTSNKPLTSASGTYGASLRADVPFSTVIVWF